MQGYCHNCAAVLQSESEICPHCGYDSSQYFPAAHQLLPETVLNGRYRVGRVLGNGGFGITYVGADTVLDRKVAIKEFYMTGFVSRDSLRSAELQVTAGSYGEDFIRNRERFLSEAKVLARFASEPGIVMVLDFFTANNTAYIVMEYLDGETLAAYLKRSGPLSWQETFKLLRPVMQCLSRVHRHDIIHRDISPDNIMLTENGQVKLLDFGAAREYADAGHSLSVILKRGYAPMEQNSRNRNMQGPWTDVYALCATMYRCLTGKVPEDAMDRINGDDVQPPHELGRCSRPVSDVLMKGLELRRMDRWQSMEELLAALEQADCMAHDQPFFATEVPVDEEATVYVGAATVQAPKTAPQPYSVPVQPKTEPKPAEPVKPAQQLSKPAEADEDATVYAGAAPAQESKAVPQLPKPAEVQRAIPETPKQNDPRTKKRTIRSIIAIAAVSAIAAIALLVSLPAIRDSKADERMDAGKDKEAIAASEAEDGHEDSSDTIAEDDATTLDDKYNAAVALMDAGETARAAMAFYALGDYKDAKSQSMALWGEITTRDTVSAGCYHTVGLKADGTVEAVGNNGDGRCDVSGWSNIVAVSAGYYHTVGLKADGTVVAVGKNEDGQCDVSDWSDIFSVSAGENHTVGLKADGTVVAVGNNKNGQCDVSGWTDIVAVSAGNRHTVGLKADGTAVAVGRNYSGQCDVSGWTDIVVVSAGGDHTVGLKADGTVVAVGSNGHSQCYVSDWSDVVAVSAGENHTVGLKADGTAVAHGHNGTDQCMVYGWTDIVAVSAGYGHTVGLKSDGTVVVVSSNVYGECDVSSWTSIKVPE